jgi:Na+-driven multidrug efflux pump
MRRPCPVPLCLWIFFPSLSTCLTQWSPSPAPASRGSWQRSSPALRGSQRQRCHHSGLGCYTKRFRVLPLGSPTRRCDVDTLPIRFKASLTSAEPATTRNDESSAKTPSYSTLIRYLSTESLIWISEPLLSLVDTACVSWAQVGASGLIQLAAMGPATTYMDTVLYLTYFLAICTTNQIAELQASDRYRDLQLCTSRLLGVAVVCGGFVSLLTGVLGSRILQRLAGASAYIHPEIVDLATVYSCIRAVAAPLSVVGMVAQAICLVTGHMRTVAESVLLASATNFVLDVLLTKPFGILGAAVATAIASSVSAMWLLRTVIMQVRTWRTNGQEGRTGDGTTSSPDSCRSDGMVPLISLPDRKGLVQLLTLSAPLCYRMWAIMGSFAMLTVRAGEFGAVSLAAQNMLIRAFYFLCAAGDSLSSAAQTFVPATIYPTFNPQAYRRVVRRLARFAVASSVGGGTLAMLSFINPSHTLWLVGDVNIVSLLHTAAPYLATCLFLHPFVTLTEGLVISKRDFRNVFCTYTITVSCYVFLLQRTAGSLAGVWRTLVFWQGLRLFNYWMWRSQSYQTKSP